MNAPPRLAVLLAGALVSVAPLASAAPNSAPPPRSDAAAIPPADLAKAKGLFDAGGRAYDQGDFEAAVQAFEQAYAIAPREGILFSIAQANRRQFTATGEKRYLDRSIELYRQYLAAVPTGGRRAEAVRALGDLEVVAGGKTPDPAPAPPTKQLERKTLLAIDSPTPGAMISVDGAEPRPPQLRVEVKPGKHDVKITAPGFADKVTQITAFPGEFTPQTFELNEKPGHVELGRLTGGEVSVDGRLVGEAPVARALELGSGAHFISVTRNGREPWGREIEVARGSVAKLDVTLSTSTQRKVSYAFLIGGGASMVASAVLFGVSFAKESEAKDTLAKLKSESISPDESQSYGRAKADRDGLRTAGAVTLGAGGGVAIVGALLFAFDTPRPLTAPPMTLRPKGAPTDEHPAERPDFSLIPLVSPEAGGAELTFRF